MRVPVYERRTSINPMSATQSPVLSPAGDFGAGTAGVLSSLASGFLKIQQDTDDARTLELFNKFKNDSVNYHENPETGIYNTRLGYSARGAYSDADTWLRKTGEEYAKELKSPRAKANFRKMARDFITQQGLANSRFEAQQVRKYQAEQADATIKNGLNEIALNPFDDEAVNVIRENMLNALELKHRHSSPEQRSFALAEHDNDIAMARFNAMMQENPEAADKWFSENKKSFSAENRQKAENALEIYHVQSVVDKLITKFPQEAEQEGLRWIREHYSGEKEERIASAYKTRSNETAIKDDRKERLLRLHQDEAEDRIMKNFILDGSLPSTEQLRILVADKQLRPEQFERIENKRDNSARRSIFMRRERTRNPNVSQQELDTAFMKRMGTTDREHREIFAACVNSMLYGLEDEKILDDYLTRGKLTTDEVSRIKKTVKTLTGVQKEFFSREKSLLNSNIKLLGKEHGFSDDAQNKIMENFITRAGLELDNPLDKDYRTKLQQIATDVLLEAIDGSGEPLTGMLWGNSELGDFREEINSRIFQPDLVIPELLPDDINLTEAAVSDAPPARQMIEGGTITGRFSDHRAYRNGQHNGLDIAAPEGTDITLSDFGTALTVTKVNTDTPSKGGGNSVTLSGSYSNGDKIDIIISHMKNDSINLKVGDNVETGTLLGKVGNTGMTSDRSQNGKVTAWYDGKSSGYHMDLKIKINGKYVNPETFTPPRQEINRQPLNEDFQSLGTIWDTDIL